jgi:hypothetical protein
MCTNLDSPISSQQNWHKEKAEQTDFLCSSLPDVNTNIRHFKMIEKTMWHEMNDKLKFIFNKNWLQTQVLS